MLMNDADEFQGSSGADFIIYADDDVSLVCEISVKVGKRVFRKWIQFVLLLHYVLFILTYEMFPMYFPL